MKYNFTSKQIVKGKVEVSGAKNSATRLLAASTICNSASTFKNFPVNLVDVQHKAEAISGYGAKINMNSKENEVTIDPSYIDTPNLIDYDVPIRTTYLLAAGILKRFKKVSIPYPGGCKIGNRGYDQHILVWENMGCKVEEKNDFIEIKVEDIRPLDFSFNISTIGGTENALISASTINGVSHIRNAYISPEIEDLMKFLRATGADIEVSGNSYIKVKGSESLKGVNFQVMPDRIEALTWIVLSTITKGELLIKNVPFEAMEVPLIHLKEAGVDIFRNQKDAFVNPECLINGAIQPFELACGTHPGVISDMQPLYVLLALLAEGTSRIYDYRYPERTKYLEELGKFCPGAIEWENGKITVQGPAKFEPAVVNSTDLRGSIAVVMAAILTGGGSIVNNVEMALRGYNNLTDKLNSLGIDIA